MNEGIRTEIREFLNSLESQHFGIKNNLYKSIFRISQIVKDSNSSQKQLCMNCGSECTGKICSVCNLLLMLREKQA
jgi:tRNA(Ile)-lysidine synthase TilS/MesJ